MLGKGGMGEVWRARDAKLDRDVAIKVLPEQLARDKERVLRFEREAKLLASLNHTNVAAIHGFEECDGKKFLVLEYVEGETLAERIKIGALPVDEALETCMQIAEALEALPSMVRATMDHSSSKNSSWKCVTAYLPLWITSLRSSPHAPSDSDF